MINHIIYFTFDGTHKLRHINYNSIYLQFNQFFKYDIIIVGSMSHTLHCQNIFRIFLNVFNMHFNQKDHVLKTFESYFNIVCSADNGSKTLLFI